MSSKLALTIGAVLGIVFGLALTLLPTQMLKSFALNAPNEAIVLSRDVGVTLIGLGIINWLARDATGPAVRALLVGNFFVQVAEFVVNAYEIILRFLPVQGSAGLVLHAILGIVFALALFAPPDRR
ncbi:MAG TPA: hypothetical protein VJQ09_07205 [Candidatus Limnocylindria bacterium]|nr:hypothetical protein [Candidatus Limnocylindria bacterium]